MSGPADAPRVSRAGEKLDRAIEAYSAHGMIFRRRSSFGACSDRASVTGSSNSCSLRIAAGRPTVETVILRAEMPRPQSACIARIAGRTWPRFASGSPMPMKTTFEMRPTPGRPESRQTCSTMRPVVRFPSRPPRPEAQKAHPTGQPTWLETQAVRRSGLGISTHSVCRDGGWPTTGSAVAPACGAPSGQPSSSFRVPSVATCSASVTPCPKSTSDASRSRLRAERLVMNAGSIVRFA